VPFGPDPVFIFAGITGKVLFNNNYVNGRSFCGERHIADTTLMIETQPAFHHFPLLYLAWNV
jgi:hypothetical protein